MPAAAAGLQTGDRILSVAGTPVESFVALVAELQRHPGERIELEVERGAERLVLPITPRDDRGIGRVGFAQAEVVVRRGPAAAVVEGLARTNAAAKAQLAAFGAHVLRQAAGGALRAGRHRAGARARARQGAEPFLALVWTISIVLAILNLLPIPALDGGRLVFLAWEIDHAAAGERAGRELRPPRRLHRARRAHPGGDDLRRHRPAPRPVTPD